MRDVARLQVQERERQARLDRRVVRRPVAVQAHAPLRGRKHTPRVAQHRGPARAAHRRLSEAGRQMDRSDGQVPRMSEAEVHYWSASDGVELAYHELGEGRSAILLHGLFSDAGTNWIRFGHSARIAEAGFRVIMPDLRAHGLSAKPHEPEHYPKAILARDLEELVAHLRLSEFDLAGFSLGS